MKLTDRNAQDLTSHLMGALLAVVLFGACFAGVWAQEQPAASPALGLRANNSPYDLSGSSKYWLSSERDLSINQMVQREQDAQAKGQSLFRPYNSSGVQIIDGRVLWICFDAVNQSPLARWYLELGLPQVDEASLYWQGPGGQWSEQRVGDEVSHGQWPIASRHPLFALSNDTDKTTRYYLRVRHERAPFAAPLRVYGAATLLAQREVEHFWLGCFVGLALLSVVAGMVTGYSERETAFGVFAAYMMVLIMAQLVSTGLGAQHVWPDAIAWRSRADFLMPALSLAAGVWLLRESLMRHRPWPAMDAATTGTTALALAAAVFDAIWPSTWGYLISSSACLVALLMVLALLWHAFMSSDAHARRMALGFAPIMLGAMPAMLTSLGLLSTGWLSQNAAMLGLSIGAPILLYALYARSAQRRLARARAQALMQSDPLTGLANDRALVQNLHGALMRAQRFRHQFGLLLIELDNLEWFAQIHGRLISDRALLLLGNRLSGVARNVDTAARLQDKAFVLLMDGPISAAQASHAAAQIVSRAMRPSDQLPVGASLKVQVTAALLPDEQLQAWGEDANACLNWLMSQTATAQGLEAKPMRLVNFSTG
jgi:two-component system, sensor histidine kinase LadS